MAVLPDGVTVDRLPRFLVLGAQKSGTTWLDHVLDRHPQVRMASPKEPHFFDARAAYEQGLAAYVRHWDHAEPGGVRGEATPNYLWVSNHRAEELVWLPGDPERWRDGAPEWKHSLPERVVARLGTELRYVVVLREPVARAVSGFHHQLRAGGRLDLDLSFRENARRFGIAHMGLYAAHLARWFEVVAREQVQVLLFEEMLAAPQAALDVVHDHLGLSAHRYPAAVLEQRVHATPKHRDAQGRYHATPDLDHVVLDHDDLTWLRDLYLPENERLAALLERDLDLWSR